MKADLDLVITHDGERWVAGNGTITATGRTLPELDASLAEALRETGEFAGSRVTVFMGFDFNTIPTWMRQYAAHYFNRYVTVEASVRPSGRDRKSEGRKDERRQS